MQLKKIFPFPSTCFFMLLDPNNIVENIYTEIIYTYILWNCNSMKDSLFPCICISPHKRILNISSLCPVTLDESPSMKGQPLLTANHWVNKAGTSINRFFRRILCLEVYFSRKLQVKKNTDNHRNCKCYSQIWKAHKYVYQGNNYTYTSELNRKGNNKFESGPWW